jgi:hypothetical protein
VQPVPFAAREVLRLAWPLFQETLLRCLPLGVLAAAASAVPSAEAAGRRAAGLPAYDTQWWVLLALVTGLVLICYDAMLRIQTWQARGQRLDVLAAMRSGFAALPATFLLLLLALAPLVAPVLWLSWRGADVAGVLLLMLALGGLLYLFFGWPALVAQRVWPWAALRDSILLVRGRYLQVASLALVLLAAILVFSLLTGIFLGVVMMLAGPAAPTSHLWLSVSRWLMAGVLALPLVYGGAVSVTAYRLIRGEVPYDPEAQRYAVR